MDVRQAQAFIAVAEELHFGRAAERLHMAQPPLSRLIRQLERELGTELFERTTHWVVLTPHGQAILDPARELVMQSQRIAQIVKQAVSGEIGRLRLGFGEAAVDAFVGDLARAIRRELPGIVLELINSQYSYLGLDRLIDGSLDLLLTRIEVVPEGFSSRTLAEEDLLIAIPEEHRLAAAARLELRDLADEPWIVLPGGQATGQNRLSALSAAGGFIPRIVEVAPDPSTLLLLVGAGVGVGPTLSSVRAHCYAKGVVFKELAPTQPPVIARLIWRTEDVSPVITSVLQLLDGLQLAPST